MTKRGPIAWRDDDERFKPKPASSVEAELPDGWRVDGSKAWQERGAWRTEVNLSETGNVGVGFSYIERDHHMGGSFPLDVLERLLARAGLAIVPASDVPTPEERKVLEAAADINVRWLESYVNIIVPTQADPQAYAFAQAELARRAATQSAAQKTDLQGLDPHTS